MITNIYIGTLITLVLVVTEGALGVHPDIKK